MSELFFYKKNKIKIKNSLFYKMFSYFFLYMKNKLYDCKENKKFKKYLTNIIGINYNRSRKYNLLKIKS